MSQREQAYFILLKKNMILIARNLNAACLTNLHRSAHETLGMISEEEFLAQGHANFEVYKPWVLRGWCENATTTLA